MRAEWYEIIVYVQNRKAHYSLIENELRGGELEII